MAIVKVHAATSHEGLIDWTAVEGGGIPSGGKAQKCEDTVASVNYSSSSKVKLQTKSRLIDIWLGF